MSWHTLDERAHVGQSRKRFVPPGFRQINKTLQVFVHFIEIDLTKPKRTVLDWNNKWEENKWKNKKRGFEVENIDIKTKLLLGAL